MGPKVSSFRRGLGRRVASPDPACYRTLVRKWLRRAGWTLATLVVLVLAGAVVAHWRLSGTNGARFVENQLNPRIRGRVEIQSLDWSLGDLIPIDTDLRVTIKGIKVYDPSNKLVLDVPEARGTVGLWDLATGHHDIHVDDLQIHKGWCLVEQYETPGGHKPTEIGLTAAFHAKPEFMTPEELRRPGPIIHLHNVDLRKVELQLHFMTWHADLHDLSTTGTLWNSGRDYRVRDFSYGLTPKVGRGVIELGRTEGGTWLPNPRARFELADVVGKKFGQYEPRIDVLVFDLDARTPEGAEVHIDGELNDLYNLAPEAGGVVLNLDVHKAGGLAARLSDGKVGGAGAHVKVRLDGLMIGPTITAQAEGVESELDGERVRVDELDATVDLGAKQGELRILRAAGLDGTVQARGALALDPLGGDVTVDIKRSLDIGRWLPANVRNVTGSDRLDGKVRAWGSIDDAHADLQGVTLGEARVSGRVHKRGDDVRPDGLVIDLPDGGATITGHVYPKRRRLALDFEVTAKRLADYLRRFRAPRVATGLQASGSVKGSFAAPEVDARITVSGVPGTGAVKLDVVYKHALERLDLTRVSAKPLGGALSGSGRFRFGRRPEIVEARLTAAEMNLAMIPGLERILGGRAELEVLAAGPLKSPSARLSLDGDSLILSGYDVGTARVRATLDPVGATLDELSIGGPASGTLGATGRFGFDRTVALDIDVRRLPLAMLPVVRDDKELNLGGYASLTAGVEGTLDAPEIQGRLDLASFAAWQTLFGSAAIELEPWPGNRMHFAGKLFQGKFTVDASVALAPPYDVQGRVAFKRVELDEFMPQISDELGIRGWVTGWVDAQTGTAGSKKAPVVTAEVHITESQIHIDREDERGRPMPLTIQNRGEIVIAWDGATEMATLITPIRFASPRGEFSIAGTAGRKKLDLALDGDVQLALADFWARRWVESIEGDAKVAVRLTGTPEKPIVQGRVALRDARVRAHGQEQELRIPSGEITLSNEALGIDRLTMDVGGQKLFVDGRIALADFKPKRADVTVRGRVSGDLLEIALPAQFSEAGGSAAVALVVTGDPLNPDVDGTITFDAEGGLVLAPRGFRRQIALTSGRIAFSNKELRLEDVAGSIDDARLALTGGVRMYNWSPIDVDVRGRVFGFYHSVPGSVALELNADLRLTGDRDELQLHPGESGKAALSIVDGRYYEKFRITDAIVPERTHERSEPIWKGKPLLERLQLHELKVVTSGTFRVDSNIARLSLRGGVEVNGTLARPSIEGIIRAEDGTFRIPGVRGEFTVKTLSVDFPPSPSPIPKKFPQETPTITLLAETPFLDRSGTEHLVNLRVEGTLALSKFSFWTTNTGLNNAQTQALLLMGRTTDDLRAKARGDQTTGDRDATQLQGARGQSGIVGASDQIIKDLTGDYVALFIEDPLKKAFFGILDTVRVGVGTESVTFSGGRKLGRVISARGEYEAGYRGWNRAFVGVDLNFGDILSIAGLYTQRKPEQETEPSEESFRVQFKVRIPIP